MCFVAVAIPSPTISNMFVESYVWLLVPLLVAIILTVVFYFMGCNEDDIDSLTISNSLAAISNLLAGVWVLIFFENILKDDFVTVPAKWAVAGPDCTNEDTYCKVPKINYMLPYAIVAFAFFIAFVVILVLLCGKREYSDDD